MLEIIHELYAVQIHHSIPDELVQEFKKDIGYDQLLKSENFDVWNQPNPVAPSSLKLFKYINGMLNPYGLGIENVDYFVWPFVNKERFTIHVDALHDLYNHVPGQLLPVNARVNFPIHSANSTMEWYDQQDIKPTITRSDTSHYFEFDKKDDTVSPIYSIAAANPLIVNASIPHTINLNNSNTDRFTISGRIRKNLPFTEIIRRIRAHV